MAKAVRTVALIHASELITGRGIAAKDGRRIVSSDMDRIPDGALVYSQRKVGRRWIPDRVLWVGPSSAVPKKYSHIPKRDLKLKRAVIPGLVDCHTHLVFAGDRADEFARRAAGATYEQIAAEGGGILRSVTATRAAPKSELVRLGAERLRAIYALGVRTIEIKSGYGLSMDDELKQLEAVKTLQERFPEMTLRATFLGAHDFPKDCTREQYLRVLIDQMLPEIARRKLADFCDVFVDQGYYTIDEARLILTAARRLGLKTKVHADELANTEATRLAVELKALSADHLLKISDSSLRALAQSETVGVLLPGTAFCLKAAYAPARALIDAGACVAVSTDFNPGSCNSLSLPFMMTLSALYMKMSAAEILAATTYGGAKALGLADRKGSLEVGKDADFAVLDVKRFEELYYRVAW